MPTRNEITWNDCGYICTIIRSQQILRVDNPETKEFWMVDGHYYEFWISDKRPEIRAMKTLVILHEREKFPLELYESLYKYMYAMDKCCI